MGECEDVLSQEDICAYAEASCGDLTAFYFCRLHGTIAAWPLLALTLLLMLYLLGSTANEYFSPALAEISQKLKISPTLAGVTLLAFGNGAPDVFSSIAAAKQDQIALSIGGVIGESLFITCVVLASCICVAGTIKVKLSVFLRDAGMFLLAMSVLGLYWLAGEITLWQSLAFPLMYVGYILVVLCTDREEPGEALSESLELAEVRHDPAGNSVSWGEIREDYFSTEASELSYRTVPAPAHSLKTNLRWSLIRMNYWLKRKYALGSQRAFASLNLFEKGVYVATFPLTVMRKVSIPLYLEDSEWNRGRAALTPPFSLILVLFVLGCKWQTDQSTALLWAVAGIPAGVFIFCTAKKSKLPPYNFVLVLASFALSVCWICSVCDYMVELLALIGILLSLPVEVLGMTLLALGNSSGDLWANTAVSRLGMPESAVAACFAGPLFNLCVGIGTALLIRTSEETVGFQLAPVTALCYFVMVAVNAYTVVYFFMGRKLTQCHSKALILVFAGFSLSLFI